LSAGSTLSCTAGEGAARSEAGEGRPATSPALELRAVRRVFKSGGAEIVVLDGVDLALHQG
jgi:hypothetical protein